MTIQWSPAALTVLASAGAGIYIAAAFDSIKGGGEIRLPGLILSAAFLAAALAVTTLTVGNPSRIANIFGHISSGFSMAMAASFLLLILSLYQLRPSSGAIPLFMGAVAAVLICAGVLLMYMKPSRPALYGWAVPVYIVSYALSAGAFFYGVFCRGCGRKLRIVKISALALQAAALVGFLWGVYTSADRYIDLPLLFKGGLAAVFYAAVIAAGLIVPAVSVAAGLRMSGCRIWSVAGFMGVLAGGAGFCIILNVSAAIRKLI